jgi:hypothetical protein
MKIIYGSKPIVYLSERGGCKKGLVGEDGEPLLEVFLKKRKRDRRFACPGGAKIPLVIFGLPRRERGANLLKPMEGLGKEGENGGGKVRERVLMGIGGEEEGREGMMVQREGASDRLSPLGIFFDPGEKGAHEGGVGFLVPVGQDQREGTKKMKENRKGGWELTIPVARHPSPGNLGTLGIPVPSFVKPRDRLVKKKATLLEVAGLPKHKPGV